MLLHPGPSGPRTAPDTVNGTVTVAVLTDDPLAGEGVAGYLRTAAAVRLAPLDKADGADVVVVVTAALTEGMLDRMRQVREASRVPHQCIVLIADAATERSMARAFRYSVVSLINRATATRESVVGAVLASGHGSAVLPGPVIRWLADTSREFQDTAHAAHGISAGGLTSREVDVVRFIGEGMTTDEIAARMNYSERTVKNIIRDMLNRLQLRNRAHAVAYAHRRGVI